MLQYIKNTLSKDLRKKWIAQEKKGSFGKGLGTQGVSKGLFQYEKDLQALMFWGSCDSQREIYKDYKHYRRFFFFLKMNQ